MNTSPSSKTPPTHPQHFHQLPHTHFPPPRNLFIPIALRTLEKTTGVYPPKANPRRNSSTDRTPLGAAPSAFRGCGFKLHPTQIDPSCPPTFAAGCPTLGFRGWGFRLQPTHPDRSRPLTFAERDPQSAVENRNQPRWLPTLSIVFVGRGKISPRSPDTRVPVRPFTLCPHVQYSLSDSPPPRKTLMNIQIARKRPVSGKTMTKHLPWTGRFALLLFLPVGFLPFVYSSDQQSRINRALPNDPGASIVPGPLASQLRSASPKIVDWTTRHTMYTQFGTSRALAEAAQRDPRARFRWQEAQQVETLSA